MLEMEAVLVPLAILVILLVAKMVPVKEAPSPTKRHFSTMTPSTADSCH